MKVKDIVYPWDEDRRVIEDRSKDTSRILLEWKEDTKIILFIYYRRFLKSTIEVFQWKTKFA